MILVSVNSQGLTLILIKRRSCLSGKTACMVFNDGREQMKSYNRRRRKEVYNYILEKFIVNLVELGRFIKRSINSAWRRAVKTWLLQAGIISISKPKSVTPFSLILVS